RWRDNLRSSCTPRSQLARLWSTRLALVEALAPELPLQQLSLLDASFDQNFPTRLSSPPAPPCVALARMNVDAGRSLDPCVITMYVPTAAAARPTPMLMSAIRALDLFFASASSAAVEHRRPPLVSGQSSSAFDR